MRHLLDSAWLLAGPSALILLLLAAGVILSWTKWQNAGRCLCLAGTLALLLVTFLPVASWLLAPLERRFPGPAVMPTHVDGIIVLGGAFDDTVADAHGLPGLNDAAERLTGFVRLSRLYPRARLISSGGSRADPGQPGEADAVEKLLRDLGVDMNRVTFERTSRNTYQNALFSRDLAQPKPDETWLLVTSAAHMPRAIGVFRKLGWPVIAVPVGYKASSRYTVNLAEHLKRFDDALHEWIGLAQYRLAGRTDRFFPGPENG